jgi:bla regulator protein blaR1
LTCASGITGADLKRRIRFIMVPRLAELTLVRRIMLAAFACLAISAPVAFGFVRVIPMYGQILHGSGPLPSFDVASVRPWQSPSAPVVPVPQDGVPVPPQTTKVSPLGEGGQTSDRVHFIGQAALLVPAAYGVPLGSEGRRIVGGPDWMGRESDRYEVQAKIGDSQFEAMKKLTPEQQRQQVALMEQALLAERFRLKAHFEMREMPMYSLV